MSVINNSSRQVFTLPGLKHQMLASGSDQLEHLEVWRQTLGDVLDRDIDVVLGAGDTGFQAEETALHEEDER